MVRKYFAVLAVFCCIAQNAHAGSTVTYRYDAQGRLIATSRSNAPTLAATEVDHDPADNRTSYRVFVAPGSGGNGCSLSVGDTFSGSPYTPLKFVISKSGTCDSDTVVNYATSDGSALAGTHYAATSGSLTIMAAQTSKEVPVPVGGSDSYVRDMYLNISVANGVGTIADGVGMGELSNND